MNVIDALNGRHSVRAFKPDPVSKDTLLEILKAANRAPSWANSQPWHVTIGSGEPLERLRRAFLARYDEGILGEPDVPRPTSFPPGMHQRMSENGTRYFAVQGVDRSDREGKRRANRINYCFFDSPVVAYICADRGVSQWSLLDVGLFAQSLMLAARELGVGSVPAVCLVDYPDLIRRELGVPEDLLVVLAIALGYPVDDHPLNHFRSNRRPLEEVVRFTGFQ